MKQNQIVATFLAAIFVFAATSVFPLFSSVRGEENTVREKECDVRRFEYEAEKMGVPVRLILYGESQEDADAAADAVFRRFDELDECLSDYRPTSELIRVCQQCGETGEAVEIGSDFYAVLSAARRFDELSGGAFDVTVSPLVKLWRRSRSFGKLPPADYLARAKELVGRDNWELIEKGEGESARHFVRTLKKNVRFDFGGIAKGYAIDEGFRILTERGFSRALVDAGGDIRFGAAPPAKKGWTVGVASLDAEAKAAFYLELENGAAATSGDTFRYVEIDGVRYSHLIDPRTGDPLTRHAVVTVLAETATAADALASAVTILGPEEGIRLAESLGAETVIFEEREDRTTEKFQSAGFPKAAIVP